MAKPVRTTKPGRIRTTHAQGVGYFIPDSMPNQDWQRVKKLWDSKLADSGFHDIELFSHALDGHFLPMFSRNSIEKNTKTQAGERPDAIAGYFDFCSTFYEHCRWNRVFKRKQFHLPWQHYREIFRLHKDGVSYTDICNAFKGKISTYMKRFSIKAVPAKLHRPMVRSTAFSYVERILAELWYWHATHELGSLTPRDLRLIQANGISTTVADRAAAYVERLLARSGSTPAISIPARFLQAPDDSD